ncbi:arrestin domain-containing protein 17 [Octopus sinensis]|uniref:Arrestin domain-containing protein 17 n=1 Tax=Octopus sinensis TaxID=2607531 RepID=A0A6P7SZ47_9MOLL|nr:arrestin domain-containing protein 17 [Octopus sinensis]
MGKLRSLTIHFNNPSRVYYGGQRLSGLVQIILNEPMKARGVRLEIKGEAHVYWSETRTTGTGENSTTTTDHYSAKEKYFDYSVVLYGSGPVMGANQVLLNCGEHHYPFEFVLPYNIPSSYEGGTGYVRYYAKAVIDKPWKFDHKCKIPFTIISVLDLNLTPNALQPLQQQGTKHFCCCCCKSGPLSAHVNLYRTGYVSGEQIYINAEICNMSNRDITHSKASLDMIISFHATTKTTTGHKNITSVTQGGIPPGESDYWNQVALLIPPLPPSNLMYCKIIDIKYILTFSVSASMAMSLKLPMEIIIGTIPLATYMPPAPSAGLPAPNQYNAGGYAPQYNSDGSAAQSGALLPTTSYPEPSATPMGTGASAIPSAPPAYEECVFGKVNISDEGDDKYTHGELNFAPAYPYYNFPSAPPLPGQPMDKA